MSKFTKALKKFGKSPFFQTFKKIAPELAAGVVGGPFAPLAMTILRKTLGKDDLDEESLEAALASGDPAIYAKIQEANDKFKLQMKQMDIDEQALYLEDVQSARQMQIATLDKTPTILSYLALVTFFGLVGLILWQNDWFAGNEFAQNLCFMIIGGSLGWANQAYNFWLGSSRGSYAKTQALQQYLTERPA